MSDAASSSDEPCANCGAARLGRYCVECGQEFAAHDRSLGHFLHELVHEVTHFDTRALRSLQPLLRRPGLLTAEYMAGRRVRYLSPLQTFMVVNLLFFLVAPSFGLLAYRLRPDAQGRFFTGDDPRQRIAEAKMRRAHETPAEFAARFDEHEAHWRKGLVVLMVPPFALVGLLLQRRRSPYFMDHLAFALHFYAFFLVAIVAVGLLTLGVAELLMHGFGVTVRGIGDAVLVPLIAISCWVYLALAVRRAYGATTRLAVSQGLALTGTALLLTPLYALTVMTATLLAM